MLASLGLLVGLLATAAPVFADESNYKLTGKLSECCKDINSTVPDPRDAGHYVTAHCALDHGRFRQDNLLSSLDLNLCLQNEFGKLVGRSNGRAMASCHTLSFNGSMLHAKCSDGTDNHPDATFNLDEIVSIDDGRMSCYGNNGFYMVGLTTAQPIP